MIPSKGRRSSRGGGGFVKVVAPIYDFAKFNKELHEVKKCWLIRRGGLYQEADQDFHD